MIRNDIITIPINALNAKNAKIMANTPNAFNNLLNITINFNQIYGIILNPPKLNCAIALNQTLTLINIL